MSKIKKEISKEQLDILNSSYPVSDESSRLQLPRLGMLSKDVIETIGTGKNKKIKIIQSSGTFFTESDEGEMNDEGKKVWTKKFIEGETIDVQIVYHRRQLRMYDSSLEKFYSTPIFDNVDQIVPLYLDKQVIKKGIQKDLQAMWPSLTLKGKPSSKLKEDTILYVIYEGTLYQCNLSQSSKWEFKSYAKNVNPSTVITTIGSVEDTFGDNTFRKMTFKNKRLIDGDEFETVTENQTIVKDQVKSDERYYLGSGDTGADLDKAAAEMTASAEKALD